MITIKKGSSTATINDDLSIATNDETLRDELQIEVDFAQMESGYKVPVLLVLYNELKTNPSLEVSMPSDMLKSLNEANDDTEKIF